MASVQANEWLDRPVDHEVDVFPCQGEIIVAGPEDNRQLTVNARISVQE